MLCLRGKQCPVGRAYDSSRARISLTTCQIKRDQKIRSLFIWRARVRRALCAKQRFARAERPQAMPAGRARIFLSRSFQPPGAKNKSPLARALIFGAPGEIRTPDPQVRSLILYPAELRAQKHDMNGGGIILDWDTAKKVS